jgi:hypothetical protein
LSENLFSEYTGNPELLTATYENYTTGITLNLKGEGNTILDFELPELSNGMFKITWKNGLFSLGTNQYYSSLDWQYN